MPDINGLTAILAAGNRRNDLSHDRTCHLEALRTLNEFAVHDGSVIQHITDIDQTAVEDRLQEIIRIMEV